MRLVFLGPPGVGKGTQASKLSKKYAIPHIATGDILRRAISEEMSLGLKAKSYIDAGKLVPDEVVIQLIGERLKHSDTKTGYILDGFPRTLAQGEALKKVLDRDGKKIDRVIYFSLDDAILLERISGRISCPTCHTVYHTIYNRPKNNMFCDCGETLVQRKDDHPATVKKRLIVYKKETAPLIAYYKDQDLLFEIDADETMDGMVKKMDDVIQAESS